LGVARLACGLGADVAASGSYTCDRTGSESPHLQPTPTEESRAFGGFRHHLRMKPSVNGRWIEISYGVLWSCAACLFEWTVISKVILALRIAHSAPNTPLLFTWSICFVIIGSTIAFLAGYAALRLFKGDATLRFVVVLILLHGLNVLLRSAAPLELLIWIAFSGAIFWHFKFQNRAVP
jgi:hypothetical protein